VERLPDPEAEMLRCLQQKIFELEDRIIALETSGRKSHEQEYEYEDSLRRKT